MLHPTTGGPAAAVASGKGVSAFFQGFDGALWWRQLTASGWWTWQAFDGAMTGTPSVVSTASGVFVFVRVATTGCTSSGSTAPAGRAGSRWAAG